MDDKVIPKQSYPFGLSDDSLYPVCFGVSLAFFTVRVLSLLPKEVGESERWSVAKENLLKGSAQLLGLLAWRVEKEGLDHEIAKARLEKAERDVAELKRMRREDAKANEKVVGIFAAQEQTWLVERRKLRQHIGALITELRRQEKCADQAASEADERLRVTEASFRKSNDESLAEEREKRKESDRKLREAEIALEERSSDLRKYKTAFIELVSNQRRVEAEMGRATRQKEESVLMVQKLSAEMVKMQKDLEQKDKILSATMRRSKLDTAERQLLLKEVKLSKAKRKEAELESERWRAVSESRRERSSLRNMFAKHANSGSSIVSSDCLDLDDGEGFNGYSVPSNEDIDVKQVENWVRSEADRYSAAIEQRHGLEISAFVEQMRLKDEKLEAFRWRHLSMELETKRLQSHVEALRHEAIKAQALLSEREQELDSLRKNRDQGKGEGEEEDRPLTLQSPENKEEGEPESRVEISSPAESTSSTSESTCSGSQCHGQNLNKANSSQWKIDLHALGVSYKLKRLKQQFIMLERLRGTRTESIIEDETGTKDFLSLMSFLNKQIGRYQSLQAKVDDLCKRMHESDLELCQEDFKVARTKEKTKILEHYLEETFQVQRYIVATGQKLVEVQAKIGSGFVGIAEELDKSTGFDLSRFSESVRSLFQDVQRGIEVRIARVIGDLEGTLACEGMISLRRW